MSSSDSSDTAAKYRLYNYIPSTAGAIIFIIVFAILFVAHVVKMIRTRGWFFTTLIVGIFMESVGYVGRYLGHNNPTKIGPFIMQNFLLLVSPALFAASIYMVLGRIVTVLGAEQLSLVRASRLTKFFVIGDVISFWIQGGGGGLMAIRDNANMARLGLVIVMVGLGVQVLWFGFFIVVSGVFHVRMRRFQVPVEQVKWTRLMYALYAASVLVLIRCIFRFIEFAGGHDGAVMSNEAYLYVFDSTLMAIVVIIFVVYHPPTYLGDMSRFTVPLMEKMIPLRENPSY